MRTAYVTIDPDHVSPSGALAAAARRGDALLVVTERLYADLAAELGGYERAAERLVRIASDAGRPLAVNLPTPDGSTTVFIAPRNWSEERLRGWAAGHHAELEAAFGPVAGVRNLEDL